MAIIIVIPKNIGKWCKVTKASSVELVGVVVTIHLGSREPSESRVHYLISSFLSS